MAAQRSTGEIRLAVTDPSGAAIRGSGSIASLSTQYRVAVTLDASGRFTAKGLPFGRYRVSLSSAGFAAHDESTDVASEVPVTLNIRLDLARQETRVDVAADNTLIDPARTGAIQHVGADSLAKRRASLPGRAVLDLVDQQPGWLLEANGVLHPRGAEYDTQYVIDGLPVFDNRSPGFVPGFEVENVQSMTVRTGGFPAEFGRKLGGVVEINTARNLALGWHGSTALQRGSFDTSSGFASVQYGRLGHSLLASGDVYRTDRYLDAPVPDNFTNRGWGNGFLARYERDFTPSDRLRIGGHHRNSRFLVPNELLQQQAGQRQDRQGGEDALQASYQKVLSPRLLATTTAQFRDVEARLWSNRLSTPIAPSQDRGFREGYFNGSLGGEHGIHRWKVGGEALFANIREDFAYRIVAYRLNNVRIFDRELPAAFRFQQERANREQAVFAQDAFRWRNLNVQAGLRFDRYRLVARESAWSPRLAAAWHFARTGTVLRASFDRVFQTPAVENVLLSSLAEVDDLGGEGRSLPLRPSRGNYYEVGVAQRLHQRVRLDVAAFRRNIRNFADDGLLLNTGVTFPIAFSKADIQGIEAKLDIPRWGRVSGSVSYSNMIGHVEAPVTGGLFLGDDVDELLQAGRFPMTQDQRNTLRTRWTLHAHDRLWFATGARYGSGLRVELEGVTNTALLQQQYGRRILDRVNFARERVRPLFAWDLAAGLDLLKRERIQSQLQFDGLNMTNQLNVINFSGLFSGTALEPGRNFSVRWRVNF